MKQSDEIIAYITRVLVMFCFSKKMTKRAWLFFIVAMCGICSLIFVVIAFGLSLLGFTL